MEQVRDVEETPEGQVAAGGEGERAPTDEWTIASLAHASALLTLMLGMGGGVGALIGLAVPLALYFGYRERSRFVSFHALQAFAYQVIGVVGYAVVAAVLAVWVAMGWTISGLLSAVLIGLLCMPFALMLTLLMVVVLLGVPLAWLGYGLYAAYEVYQGRDFRYWLIGEWLEREVRA